MSRMHKYNWFSKLPIVVVYLLFFTVQIFYNLDTNRRIYNTQRAVTDSYSQNAHKPSVFKAATQSNSQHKLWLNKRYQPSTVPVPAVIETEVPVLCFKPLRIGTYVIPFYTSVLLSAYGLRGPPAVA